MAAVRAANVVLNITTLKQLNNGAFYGRLLEPTKIFKALAATFTGPQIHHSI